MIWVIRCSRFDLHCASCFCYEKLKNQQEIRSNLKFQLFFQQLQMFLVLLALLADGLVEFESFPFVLTGIEDDTLYQVL